MIRPAARRVRFIRIARMGFGKMPLRSGPSQSSDVRVPEIPRRDQATLLQGHPMKRLTFPGRAIQRVNATGGTAPTTAGTVGEVRSIPYAAEYFFYRPL